MSESNGHGGRDDGIRDNIMRELNGDLCTKEPWCGQKRGHAGDCDKRPEVMGPTEERPRVWRDRKGMIKR